MNTDKEMVAINYIEEVKRAYRKLKGTVYLDKTVPFLRNRIVSFEGKGLDSRLEAIGKKLNGSNKVWEDFIDEILSSIKVLTFPKLVTTGEEKRNDEPIFITNKPVGTVFIEKYNNYIDMSVEGHILGVLWILTIGYKIDNELIETCYGNRLYENLKKEKECRTTSSPNLMKPYFQQYESWRDEGLKMAEDCLKEHNKNIIITMLDLSKYYYSVELDFKSYKKLTERFTEDGSKCEQRLNEFVFRVFYRYSCFFNLEAKYAFLPIGFLPSNIIANYYLNDFDQNVITNLNPMYYGRYVDDIIIVSQVDKKSELLEGLDKNGISGIIEKTIETLHNKKIIAMENNKYYLTNYKKLEVQQEKFRFFYFDKAGSMGILDKIRKDIANNTSEFNFLPIEAGSLEKDYSNIFKLERDDSVNKIRGISKAQIGKYELSKTIAKHLSICKFVDGSGNIKFMEELDKIFDNQTILNNYTLWESVFNYYIVNNQFDRLKEFVYKIIDSFSSKNMDETTYKIKEYASLKNQDIWSVKDSLFLFLVACLARATSIVWGKKIKAILEDILQELGNSTTNNEIINLLTFDNFQNKRRLYVHSRMVNKYLIPITIEECMTVYKPNDDENEAKMYSIDEYLKAKGDNNIGSYKYSPFIVKPFEIAFTDILKSIKKGEDEIESNESISDSMIKEYGKNFWDESCLALNKYIVNIEIFKKNKRKNKRKNKSDNDRNISAIKICSDNKKSKFRIAVANVQIDKNEFENVLLDKKYDKSKRYNEIAYIVNEAIKHEADMLIMPESYVPIEYLPQIQQKVVAHNMIIVCGLDHIKINTSKKSKVYNLMVTLLPLKTDDFSYTIPYFHQKVHFSPSEKGIIEDYGFEAMEGNEYTLFVCSDLWFVPYCCFELTSIKERSIFQSYADLVVGVEWNKDTKYFGNIVESLSRDLHCYCAQANTSEYGDSRITQPTSSSISNIVQVKGGLNPTILVGEIDVKALREYQYMGIWGQDKNKKFKPTPPNLDKEIVFRKMHGNYFNE